MAATEVNINFVPNKDGGGQEQFLNLPDDVPMRSLMGGIGSGKSTVGAFAIAEYALTYKNRNIMVVAPTYDMLTIATLESLRYWLPDAVIKSYSTQKGRMELITGSVIWLRSATNPQRLRGPNLDAAWIDEAALVSEETWLLTLGRVRVLREGADKSPSFVQITTTPKGRNWIYKHFVTNATPEHKLINMPTEENRGNLRLGYIETLKASYTEDFADQELGGKFVTFSGLVYREFDRQVHTFTLKQGEAWVQRHRFQQYVAGVDWGYTNPGVIEVFGVDGDSNMAGLAEYYSRRLMLNGEGDTWLHRAQQVDAAYPGIVFVCDPSEPQNIELFRNAGLDARPAINDIQPGISEVASRLKEQNTGSFGIQFSTACVNALAEFEQYHYADPNGTRNGNEKPVKESDHAMDATRYAAMYVAGAGKQPTIYTGVPIILGATSVGSRRR